MNKIILPLIFLLSGCASSAYDSGWTTKPHLMYSTNVLSLLLQLVSIMIRTLTGWFLWGYLHKRKQVELKNMM